MAERPARRVLGEHVEQAALEYLSEAGLRLLDRNAHARGGEIDLVMGDGDGVVFVEVRYRGRNDYGGGAASVDAGKRRRVVHAAMAWLQRHPALQDAPCRFDVVDASGPADAPMLAWIRDAFRADD